MSKRILSQVGLVVVTAVLVTIFQPLSHLQSFAQPGCQEFKETGKKVCGKFLTYWQQNGGLRQQGFPISNEFSEKSDLNGQTYTVQYFERAVFELHPENPAPNDVLLSQLGTFQFKRKYEAGAISETSILPFLGVWKGQATAKSGRAYTITATLVPSPVGGIAGTIAYPSLSCGAELTLRQLTKDTIELGEQTTMGNCPSEGIVTLKVIGSDTLEYRWADKDGKPSDTGNVKKASGKP